MKLSKIRAALTAGHALSPSPRLWQPAIIATVYALTITCCGLLNGTRGAFTAWVCLTIGVALGFVAGLDFDRTQRNGPIRRMERDLAEQGARLTLVDEQNAALIRLNNQAKRDLALAIETSESHYAEILRLRAGIAGEAP
ncbi:hypothetical protein [Streptosporangium sp. G12]